MLANGPIDAIVCTKIAAVIEQVVYSIGMNKSLIILVALSVFTGPLCAQDLPIRLPHTDLADGKSTVSVDLIDDYFKQYWKQNKIKKPKAVDDYTFARRASLTINGVSPTFEELQSFANDPAKNKRSAFVDKLLKNSRYADYWGFRLRQWILELREVKGQGANFTTLYNYTRKAFAHNYPWDKIAYDIVATQGAIKWDGRSNFGIYFDGEANEMSDAAVRLFLGQNIACAQCHDHPYVDEWKQESYWGLAAFFARVEMWDGNVVAAERFDERFADIGRDERSIPTLIGGESAIDGGGGENRAIADNTDAELEMPDPENPKTVVPTTLAGRVMDPTNEPGKNRRWQFARWLVGAEENQFAKAAVNRIMVELTGHGFVDTLDGFSPIATVHHESLLDQLSHQFIESGYDVKWLIRTIANSRVFQTIASDDDSASFHWNSVPIRQLNSDQWVDSVLRSTGKEVTVLATGLDIADLLKEEENNRIAKRHELIPVAAKKIQQGDFSFLADELPVVDESWKPHEISIDDEQRKTLIEKRNAYTEAGKQIAGARDKARASSSPTSVALFRMNGDYINQCIDTGNTVAETLEYETAEDRLQFLFLRIYNRIPSKHEMAALLVFADSDEPSKIKDLLWAMLQSVEFQSF